MSKRSRHGEDIRFMQASMKPAKKVAPDAIGELLKETRGKNYRQEMVAVHFERVPNVLMKKVNLCVQVFSRIKIGRVIQLSKEFYATDSMDQMRKQAELLGGAAAEECNSRYGDMLKPEEYARAALSAFDISVADVAKHNRLTRGMVTE